MYDDDRDALAAEYVLGTLSADERDQAEALLAIDPGFAEIVRVWERRLGELNVMVEAVEPPPEVWDKIRTRNRHRRADAARVETDAIAAAGTSAESLRTPPRSRQSNCRSKLTRSGSCREIWMLSSRRRIWMSRHFLLRLASSLQLAVAIAARSRDRKSKSGHRPSRHRR